MFLRGLKYTHLFVNMPFVFVFLGLMILGMVSSHPVVAAKGNSQLSGKEVARRVHDRNVGDNSVAKVEMQLNSRDGYSRTRQLTIYTQDTNHQRKTMLRFTEPADIAGTGFLSLETGNGQTDQFLYLPALKRTRRIVSSQKDRSFVNTDFTYEDIERRPVEDFSHSITGHDVIAGQDCWIVESKPRPETESGYSLIRNWIPPEIYVPLKTFYFDHKGKHSKTYTVQSLEKIQDIWTPTKVTMHDLHDDHTTIMTTRQIKYNTKVPDTIFTTRYLERW